MGASSLSATIRRRLPPPSQHGAPRHDHVFARLPVSVLNLGPSSRRRPDRPSWRRLSRKLIASAGSRVFFSTRSLRGITPLALLFANDVFCPLLALAAARARRRG